MTDIDFQARLGIWPNDYARQIEYFNRLKLLLQEANTQVIANSGLIVQLNQATEPTQAQWEAAWTAQTGLALPIPASAKLLWWNTDEDNFGGNYGTVIGSNTVSRRQHLYPYKSTVALKTAYKTDRITGLVHVIGTSLSNYPSVSVTLPVKADLELYFGLYVRLSSGSGTWGIDFSINGIKVGSQYLGLSTNVGIKNAHVSGELTTRHVIENVEPGTYTIQSMFGVTNNPITPPTLIIGGTSGADSYGARSLIVRAIAK